MQKIVRFLSPGVLNYVAARFVQPYILPLFAVGIGAAITGGVYQRLTNRYPVVRNMLYGAAVGTFATGVIAAVVYFVGINQPGPLTVLSNTVGNLIPTVTTQDMFDHLLIGGFE